MSEAAQPKLKANTVHQRLRRGWSLEDALATPLTYKTKARQVALANGEKYYEGKPHAKCGTTTKFVHRSCCVNCFYKYFRS